MTEQIKSKTGHLPGVAIAIMGCIVNGPGEMADADFGYVGGAPGKVDLYVGKEVVRRGIPNALACDELVQLIKDYGRWQEPPSNDSEVRMLFINLLLFPTPHPPHSCAGTWTSSYWKQGGIGFCLITFYLFKLEQHVKCCNYSFLTKKGIIVQTY